MKNLIALVTTGFLMGACAHDEVSPEEFDEMRGKVWGLEERLNGVELKLDEVEEKVVVSRADLTEMAMHIVALRQAIPKVGKGRKKKK